MKIIKDIKTNPAKYGHVRHMVRMLLVANAPLAIVQLVMLIGNLQLDHRPNVDQSEYFAGKKAIQNLHTRT